MKHIFLILLLLPITLKAQEEGLSNKEMTQYIFEDLNTARADPHAYLKTKNWGDNKPFKLKKSIYKSKDPLILSDSLSLECQRYAELLAKRERLDHSDSNTNESIWRGCCYFDIITDYITEFMSETGDGHRKMILGINNNDTRVGIGVAISSDGTVYNVLRTID